MAKSKVTVKQDPKDEVPLEVLARAIEDIAGAMRKLDQTRVSRRLVVALIHDQTRLTKTTIEAVLDSYESLETTYLKKRGK